MKYFDINTLARPRPTEGIRLRTPRARHHDIQKPWTHNVVKIAGVMFEFKATPVTPGSVPIGASMDCYLNWNTPVVSPIEPLTVTSENVHQIFNQMLEKLKLQSNKIFNPYEGT
jgi:hypothetical protein